MNRAARAVVLLVALAPAGTFAAEPHPLRYDLRRDGAIAAATATAWIASELAKPVLGPSECRICEPNALDAGARNLLVWNRPGRARRASDIAAFGVLPGGVIAHQLLAARAGGDLEAGLVDVLLVAEATAIALDLDQIVKYSAGRERPFLHYGNEEGLPSSPDDNLSFYSGHTTLAFSLATAAGTISTLRGYRSAPWVWGIGMAAATTIGYLRMAGDMHYLTDVLTGAALGSAIGFAVPWFAHRDDGTPRGAGTAVVPVPFGFVGVF